MIGPHNAARLRITRTRAARIGGTALLGIAALLTVGSGYQALATAHDEATYPAPGQLVDIGDRRMHIVCTGPDVGGPTIVLDHGGGGLGGLDWSYAMPRLAELARVCAYDRAGYGWSDPSPLPRTVEHETTELHELLERAEVPKPYVLVAASLGGYTSRLFATEYPDEVGGLVLVDVSHENTWTHDAFRTANAQFGVLARLGRATAPIGLWRALGAADILRHPFPALMPDDLKAPALAMTYRSDYWRAIREETAIENLEISADVLTATRRPLGALPLVILSAGAGYPDAAARDAWIGDHAELRSLSTRSEHRVLPDATHFDILTGAAIEEVVMATRDVLAQVEGDTRIAGVAP